MPKFLSVLLIALLVASCHCGGVQKAPKNPSAVVSHVSNATVMLVYTHVSVPEVDCDKQCGDKKDDDQEEADPPRPTLDVRSMCAAVWISRDMLATAKHCVVALAEVEQVGDPENVVVHYTTSFEAPAPRHEPYGVHLASVLKIDPDNDIALLKASGPDNAMPMHDVARIADAMPGVGEELWIVGHPKGMLFSVAKGSVTAYRNYTDSVYRDYSHWIQVQAPMFYGNSGGGAFDSDGNLVGICSNLALYGNGPFSAAIVPGMTYFVDARWVRKLVEESRN